MLVESLVLGVVLLVAAAAILRYRAAIARRRTAFRVDHMRRNSMLDSKYVDREAASLTSAEGRRLSEWLVVVGALVVALAGVVAIVNGVAG
jgi:hypothetical protein